ncbi:MAG: hypothetical protein M0R37_12530 [Bacteroidales bacterium]|nr:hypothetical protein [Bacteroidales bacterium]
MHIIWKILLVVALVIATIAFVWAVKDMYAWSKVQAGDCPKKSAKAA